MAVKTNQPVLKVVLGGLSLAAWSYLVVGRGRFWRSGPVLSAAGSLRCKVTVVIPARDEAEHIEATLRSLLSQQYGGELRVLLVDDNSSDGTGSFAQELAQSDYRLRVIQGARRCLRAGPASYGLSSKACSSRKVARPSTSCSLMPTFCMDRGILLRWLRGLRCINWTLFRRWCGCGRNLWRNAR